MTLVKICGLRRTEDVLAVNRVKPDFAGMILADGFRRTVDRKTAEQLKAMLLPDIRLTGVFFNDEEEKILSYLNDGVIDIAQLHGQESDAMVKSIKEKTGKPVWKVFQMTQDTDCEQIEASSADLVLLDAGTGCGRTFDWSLVKKIRRPFILAGGLTPENVEAAVEQTHPYAVDTSSGVETDGWKDENKIASFTEAVRERSI